MKPFPIKILKMIPKCLFFLYNLWDITVWMTITHTCSPLPVNSVWWSSPMKSVSFVKEKRLLSRLSPFTKCLCIYIYIATSIGDRAQINENDEESLKGNKRSLGHSINLKLTQFSANPLTRNFDFGLSDWKKYRI